MMTDEEREAAEARLNELLREETFWEYRDNQLGIVWTSVAALNEAVAIARKLKGANNNA